MAPPSFFGLRSTWDAGMARSDFAVVLFPIPGRISSENFRLREIGPASDRDSFPAPGVMSVCDNGEGLGLAGRQHAVHDVGPGP